jgi:hypothetical protein
MIPCYVKLKAQEVKSIGTVNGRWCNAGLHPESKQRQHAQRRKNVLSFIHLLSEGNKRTEIHCHMKLQYSNTTGVHME